MQCPRCDSPLAERCRVGIPVNVCPRCGGVWLDRGKLAQLVARLWELQNGWDVGGEGPRAAIRWTSRFRYPRRHPKRRLGPIDFSS